MNASMAFLLTLGNAVDEANLPSKGQCIETDRTATLNPVCNNELVGRLSTTLHTRKLLAVG